MQVLVLGPIQIVRDGSPASVGPRIQQLLAALVAQRGSVVSSEALAEMIWDGQPPASAETTLRSYVTRLRKALEPAAVVFRGSGYELDTGQVEVDADLFVDEIDRAMLASRMADHETAAGLVARALARWSGRPFGDFGDHEWARPERVSLEERHAEAQELHVEILLAGGQTEHAVAAAGALVEQHPLRERPRELSMRALYLAGRRADAVRVFRDYREVLGEETGLDPSNELAELEGEILVGSLARFAPAGRARGYELGDVLGRGAFSVVHRATQPGVGREVAVKIIRAELADQPDFVRRFEHEAQLVASVEHRHVVPLYDFWREPGAAYLAMRWMRGGSLAAHLRRHGPISRDHLCRVMEEIGGALSAAHRAGVLHRDVRPANILVDEDGAAYLADFGIGVAIALAADDQRVHYAAPELLRDADVDASADVLSLGVTAFELLSGRLPMADTTDRAELVRRQLTDALPSVRATRSDLSPSVDDVLARATSKVAADRHRSIIEFVDDLSAALGAPVLARDGASRSDQATNPYVGLHAFTESDADRFHGRDRLVAELAEAVEHHRLVTVVGPSGSGKSSVVRAGLVPAIRAGAVPGSSDWFVTTMFPGSDPIDALETALLRVAVNPPASLREQLAEDGGLLRAVRRVVPDDASTVLLVIDQFEELFTVVETDALKDRFLGELAAAVEAPGSPLRIVATLRADHYDAPLRSHALAELVSAGTVAVRPMQPDELEQAIARPAANVGVDIDSALVADLVAGVVQQPATLPLLQFALTELYERRAANTMTLETHRSLGGLTGALSARAERIVERCDDRDLDIVRRMFSRLVAFGDAADGDARRRAPLAEFGEDERTAWVIDKFVDARLLVVDRDDHTREPTLEVAHEALLREWPRLGQWLDDDRDDLRAHRTITTGAGEWQASSRDDGALARGGRLQLVGELADRRPDLLNDDEREWVERSRLAAAETAARERRQHRLVRRALMATAVLLVFAIAAAAIALVLRGRADENRRAAEARELILEAERALEEDPTRALLLGIEAVEQYQDSGDPVPASATGVLRRGLAVNREIARIPGGEWVAVSADGSRLFTNGENGSAVVWDWREREQLGVLDHPDPAGIVHAWSEGDTLFTITVDGGGRRELLAGGHDGARAKPVAPGVDLGVWVDANETVDTLVTLDASGVASLWSIDDEPEVEREISAVLAVDLVGSRLAVVVDDGDGDGDGTEVRLIDLDSSAEHTFMVDTDFDSIALSPMGDRLAASRSGGEVAVFELESGDTLWRGGGYGLPRGPSWSADGRTAIVGTLGPTILIDAETGSVDEVGANDSGTDINVAIPGTSVIASTSQIQREVVVFDGASRRGGGLSSVDAPIVAALAAVVTPLGDVVLLDRRDYTVVDPTDGSVIDIQRGSVDAGQDPNVGWTFPFALGDPGYAAVYQDASHLRTTSDAAIIWTAPDDWQIRGIDYGARHLVISRLSGAGSTTELVTMTGDATEGPLSVGSSVELVGAPSWVWGATFSPSGDLLIVSSFGEDVIFRSDGARVGAIEGLGRASGWSFIDDDSRAVSGLNDGRVAVLDVSTLIEGGSTADALVHEIAAHDTRALAIEFSPDGSMVASTAVEEPAKVWDLLTGELVAEFGSDGSETAIAFHPTEPWVYVAEEGVLTTHTLDVDELLEAARASVSRELTAAECERYLRRSCEA